MFVGKINKTQGVLDHDAAIHQGQDFIWVEVVSVSVRILVSITNFCSLESVGTL